LIHKVEASESQSGNSYPVSYYVKRNRKIADEDISSFQIKFWTEQEALDTAMEMWETQQLTQYTIGYQNRYFWCSDEYTACLLISVQDGVVMGVIKRNSRDEGVLPEVPASVYTMNGIFGTNQEGGQSERTSHCYRV
jgi:hypothetical protein